jgi:hypothetical protein
VSGGDWNQEQVFVGDIDTVETPEGRIPSIIRLETLDQFDRCRGGTVDLGNGTCLKVGLRRTYWERTIVRGGPAVLTDQVVCEQVKGGAQIMNAVANNRPHSRGIASLSRKR